MGLAGYVVRNLRHVPGCGLGSGPDFSVVSGMFAVEWPGESPFIRVELFMRVSRSGVEWSIVSIVRLN